MRLRWKKRALNNFFAIKNHVAKYNPNAAERVGAEIQAAAIRLKQFPRLGHPGERIGVLELQVPGRPYLLLYCVEGEVIEILSVFDQRRGPEDML